MRHVNFGALTIICRLSTIFHWIPHPLKPPYRNFFNYYIKTTCPSLFYIIWEIFSSLSYTYTSSPYYLSILNCRPAIIHAVFEKSTKCLNVLSSYPVYSPEDCLLNMKPMVSKNGLSIVLHLFISPFISHPFWKVPESSSKIRKRF